MKPTIENLKDTFKIGYENFAESRAEAEEVYDFFHNRQYSDTHIAILNKRGQPVETYNVIKMFGRMFLGYLGSVINDIKIIPRQQNDIYTAAILNDLVTYTLQQNNFSEEANKVKLDGILSGLMCVFEKVEKTGETDMFGNPLFEIKLQHIPSHEIILDPQSRSEDYSDAKFIHRYRWISEEDFINNFGKDKLDEVEANINQTEVPEADLSYTYNTSFMGKYKRHNNYLVIHTIMKDYDDKKGVISYSVFWCGDVILDSQEINYDKVKFPYRVQKLSYSNRPEYYGLFREIIETQKAINQALLKIQTMANTRLVFVQKKAVDNLRNFTDKVSSVNAVIEVNDLNGIKIENQTRDIAQQYAIIDKAMERIKAILSINDSFLGLAYASDSAKKVQVQQQASIVALKYLISSIESFYRLLGYDIIYLIQQYFTATQTLSIVDEYAGQRFFTINQPIPRIDRTTGLPMINADGSFVPLMEEVLDNKGNPVEDDNGNILVRPIPTRESDIQFTKADVIVESVAYNDDLAQNQQILNDLLNGNMGQFLMQTNPAGYAQIASLSIKNLKARVSPEIAEILSNTGQMIQQQQAMAQQQAMMMQQANQIQQ